MQPTQAPRSARSSGESRSSATTSLTPTRPPGLSTRAISRSTCALVGREVDDAVRDHDVDALGRQRHVLDLAAQEVDVGGSRLGLVALGEREHLLRHVEPVDDARGADAARGEQHVDAAARAEVEHRLSLPQLGDGGGVAAPEARRGGALGEACALVGVVQRLTELRRVVHPRRTTRAAAAALLLARRDGACRLGIPGPDVLAQCL